jgi:hypothetical protein
MKKKSLATFKYAYNLESLMNEIGGLKDEMAKKLK